MHVRTVVLAAVLLALLSSSARAEEEWYGPHVLATDAGGSALLIGGLVVDLPLPVLVGGIGMMMLGGPIVHVAHDNDGRAAVSLGVRVGGVLVGAAVGAGFGGAFRNDGGEGPRHRIEPFVYAVTGAFIAYVTAAVVDIMVIAREDDATTAARMFSFGGSF